MNVIAPSKPGCTSLGTIGKSSVTQTAPEGKTSVKDEQAQRNKIHRYKLQRQAQNLLPEYRNIASCGRNVQYRADNPGVDLIKNKSTGKVRFANVTTCKSVWACPICAHRVTEERRADLQTAVTLHSMKGGKVVLMTLTFPHDRDSSLKDLLKNLSDALKRFNAVRQYRNLLKEVGFLGGVRALEVTYGDNGWHPHIHVLLFINDTENATEILNQARDHWAKAVFKAGLGQINEHGFDVRGGDYAAEYVAKSGKEPDDAGWTAAHELTKAPVKMGRKKNSYTPFQLLDASLQGDSQASALFVEYVGAFKGKRQLYWSPGLRDKLGLEQERSDDEILADAIPETPEEETELVGTLKADDWNLVLSRNARGEVLVLAERHGWAGVRHLLDELRKRPPSDSGAYYTEAVIMVKGKPVERLMLSE